MRAFVERFFIVCWVAWGGLSVAGLVGILVTLSNQHDPLGVAGAVLGTIALFGALGVALQFICLGTADPRRLFRRL